MLNQPFRFQKQDVREFGRPPPAFPPAFTTPKCLGVHYQKTEPYLK